MAGQNLSAFVLDHVVEKAALGPPCLLLGRCDPLELVELLAASPTFLMSEIGAGTDQFEVCMSTVSAPRCGRGSAGAGGGVGVPCVETAA